MASSKKSAKKTISKLGSAKKKKNLEVKSKSKSKNTVYKDQLGGLPEALILKMHDLMVKSRVLEERLIKIYRAGDSYFWIGGPGEEAWGVPLGLLARAGQGLEFDFMHLHYRCTPTVLAMGVQMIDAIRLMMNRSTDPSTGGRNFSNHYVFPHLNIAPVTSPLEVQYPMACGTAHAQKRFGKKSISIVTGGDAGTAEGDFASALILASRRGQELPVLITVQNNKWGISTSYEGQHGENQIADRASAFNIKSRVINGNDPIESYLAIKEDTAYIRQTGKPAFIEAHVSRLYGHSSASGANADANEVDPVRDFEKRLIKAGLLTVESAQSVWQKYEDEGVRALDQVRSEPSPTADTVWDHTYANNENADWRKF